MIFFKKKQAEIQQDSNYPNLSLTKWGNPVLEIVDQKFKAAQALSVNGRKEEALRSFNDCFKLVIDHNSSLFIEQLLNILLHIGYAFADLGDMETAIKIYEIRKDAISQTEGWNEGLPSGLKVMVTKDFGKDILLAQNYQELAIAYYHTDKRTASRDYFNTSSEIFKKLGHYDMIFKNCYYLANLARQYYQWEDLLIAAQKIDLLPDKEKTDDIFIFSSRCKIEANANLGKTDYAISLLENIINFQEKHGIKGVESDKDYLEDLIRHISKT